MKSIKMNKWFLRAMGAAIVFMPTQAFAESGDPTSIVTNLTNKISTFFMVISPSIATVAIMALGVMYKMTTDGHKKSEYKGHMKSTLLVAVLVTSASGIVKWILN
ncbi:hypothetical protein BC30090_p318 (plasmid) [Bacillus cereus]|jgi:hypothetical protein|uniref:pilin n=1 Tax=Bacillus TaxID=1386 RepID=UPI001BB355E9|nr:MULTISPECIES: pilin [Bacillus]BCC80218.1 hypothetical protein BCJMU62_p227 [Bacillus cereus]BCD26894.1 hypothetical protein BC30090_p318 [Bacillus cereus]GMB79183.1 hypothetical protein BCER1_55840 [Bacillus cereus]